MCPSVLVGRLGSRALGTPLPRAPLVQVVWIELGIFGFDLFEPCAAGAEGRRCAIGCGRCPSAGSGTALGAATEDGHSIGSGRCPSDPLALLGDWAAGLSGGWFGPWSELFGPCAALFGASAEDAAPLGVAVARLAPWAVWFLSAAGVAGGRVWANVSGWVSENDSPGFSGGLGAACWGQGPVARAGGSG